MTTSSTEPNRGAWDAFVMAQGGHLLQTARWGELKRAFGWQDQIVALADSDQIVAGVLVLYRRLPLRVGTIAYIPRGPLIDWGNEALAAEFWSALDSAASQRRAILLKIEPDCEDTPALQTKLSQWGFRPSAQTVQPPRTILIDLNGGDQDILARMNQGTRRKIRTSAKREVTVRRGDARDLDSYSALAAITGKRDGFGVHSPAYYKKVFELFAPDHAALFMASHAGEDLAGLMVFSFGKSAWYLYGASSGAERERMPNYALQWAAIRWAREQGCTCYDLWGIPDEDERTLEAHFQQRSDGLWGVYGFKRGFGGRVWRSVGAWDRVYNPMLYRVYRALVTMRD